jgi:acetylornithine deacetylase
MTLPSDLRDRIIKSVADGFDDQIAFTQKLVQMPSLLCDGPLRNGSRGN